MTGLTCASHEYERILSASPLFVSCAQEWTYLKSYLNSCNFKRLSAEIMLLGMLLPSSQSIQVFWS